jgi:hypothetical protein
VRDPAIQQATASYVAEQLLDQDALAERAREILPDRVDALAPTLAGGVAELAERAALRALRSGAFQQLWEETNRLAHEQLVDLVEGDSDTAVIFDLRPMLGQVAERIGLGPDVVDRLPEDRGRLVIIQGDKLETVRSVGSGLKTLAIVLVLLAMALFAGAAYVSRDRRRTLLQIGLGIIVAGMLILVLRRLVGAAIIESLTSGGAAEPAADATWNIGTSLLREIAAGVVFLGIIFIVCGWLAGPGRRAIQARTWMAPTLRDQPAMAYGIALGTLLVALVVGVLPGAARPFLVLVYLALVTGGVTVLRRQVTAEGAA